MMEAHDMLLWTVQGNSVCALPEIEQPGLKIQEFYLTVPKWIFMENFVIPGINRASLVLN
jgi:hypothetical protein